jgi:putative transposase
MKSLDEIINESPEAREVKRALSVKMALQEVPTSQITALLNVSPQYVSKWRIQYEAGGAESLLLGYRGSESYLSQNQREEICDWIQGQASLTVEALRDYIQEQYEVVYQSKQSYYDLLQAAGWSYHKSGKSNPKRDEVLIMERRQAIKKSYSSTGKRSCKVR